VRRCQELPGQQLFEYVDARGQLQSIGSADVNEYLRAFAGQEFTAKDFRTWAGTVLAASALSLMAHERPARSLGARKRHIVAAIDWVARALGNTRSVCRKGYIHPAVLDAYMAGVTLTLPKHADPGKAPVELLGDRAVERAVLSLLRQRRGPPRTDPGRSQSVQAVGRATEPVSSGYITSSLAARAREPSSGSSLATRRTDGVPAAVARSRQRVWGWSPMRTQ
jgi:DNA topoisomerase-1